MSKSEAGNRATVRMKGKPMKFRKLLLLAGLCALAGVVTAETVQTPLTSKDRENFRSMFRQNGAGPIRSTVAPAECATATKGLQYFDTSANVVKTCDGTAYRTEAVTGTNSIVAADIATGGVATAEILNETILSEDIFDGTIVAADIATGGVATAEILDGTITVDDIATSGVATAEILDATILNGDIADDAIRQTKLDQAYLQDEFRGIPHCELPTGEAATGATGDTDRLITSRSIWEYHIKGAGQTVICPTIAAAGIDISLDETNTEGVEITAGISALRAPGAFTIGTSAAFKSCVALSTDDASGAAVLLTGFRKAEAYQADENDYSDYALIGSLGTSNPNTIQLSTELNGAAATITNTTDTWADNATKTLCTNVSGAGVVTYTINGVAPTATAAYTFDTGDVVIPVLYFLHGGDVANLVTLQSWEVGLQ